jgi:hypothetical protein|tara:strand:- start:25 stop:165 length:141 start_codon:yes stop_codon:yes gene_type:complete
MIYGQADVFIPTTLSIENGRLNLRVGHDDRWEKIEIRSKYGRMDFF